MIPVCIAALCQLSGISFFICQPEDQCSSAPCLASWLALLAILCLLTDIELYPCRYTTVSKHWQVLVEILASIFLVEIFTMFIWCSIERLIFLLTNQLINALGLYNCCYSCIEYGLQGLTTGAAGFALLRFAMQATDTIYRIKRYMKKMRCNSLKFWRTARAVYCMNKRERQRTLKLAKTRRRRGKRKVCPDYDYDECDDECDDECYDE